MYDPTSDLPAWAPYATAGVGLTATLAIGMWIGGRRHRAHRTGRRRRAEDALTFVAAALATAVTSQGMWRVFEHRLHMPLELRVVTFAFLEIAMLTCGIRARSNIADPEIGKAGPEGAAVWALAGFSGFVAATDSGSWHEALIRLAAPLAAAWLWERGLHVQRTQNVWSRRRRWFSSIHWRITPERILVALGAAEPQDRTAAEVDVDRHITRLAVANARLTLARRPGRKLPGTLRRANARAQRAWLAAVKHTPLAHDPELLARVEAETALLVHATAYADLPHRPSWMPAPAARPQICLGAHAGPGLIALRVLERGKRRILHPEPAERPSATTTSLLARIQQRRTDRRLGIRPGSDSTPHARTDETRTVPRTDNAPQHRTDRTVRATAPTGTAIHTGPRTAPRLNPYGTVLVMPVRTTPSGLALPQPSTRTGRTVPGRTDPDRTNGTARTPAQAPSPPRPEPTADQADEQDGRKPDRTDDAPEPPRDNRRKSKEHWARALAEEIRTATEQSRTWEPDYPALMARTRYGKSWCEKRVREAKALAAQPRTAADPRARTAIGT
ncbi:hypothetical protein [Actinomadura sp. WMMA1423]|uniref:hypothetical protein n=1 Tax=Actinomadura sp. WMMA1423 TaxID=2591108 RepID=UPI001146F4BC|nr:hypothetical protein [Actinomadura sp. WMMA1423]